MPLTLTAKLRCRYSSVTDAPPIRSMIAAVWKIGVDAVDGGRHGLRVADVALDHLEPRMGGQRGRGSVEGADLVPAVEQFGHEVGADEAGASGDQHAAEFSADVRSRRLGSQR